MTCTGHRYPVNPDAPDEGTDVRHTAACPRHPSEEWIEAASDAGLLPTDDLDVADDDPFPAWLDRWEAFTPVPGGGYVVASRPDPDADGYLALITESGAIRTEVRFDLNPLGYAVMVAVVGVLVDGAR